jgi:hypothetical protein
MKSCAGEGFFIGSTSPVSTDQAWNSFRSYRQEKEVKQEKGIHVLIVSFRVYTLKGGKGWNSSKSIGSAADGFSWRS